MKAKSIGIIIIILGILMLTYTGFTYITKEKVVDIGPVQISKEKKHHVNWPPIAGAILIVGGIVIFVFNRKN